MKQRFSSLDVKVIAHELSQSLVSLRLANIYDLSSKILLLKFAKPDNKQQLIIDSGFRCHLTDFARTTAAAPSAFVARLRKSLKTRRCTSVSQVGTDRIIEFQFSDGQYRLYLEFFASGNVICTDGDLKILTLLRNVPEGEGQEPQGVGMTYSLEKRQNYGGVPALTRDRLRSALQTAVEKAAAAAVIVPGKKSKRKPGDELRRGLATTLEELPPMLVDHAFEATGFDPTKKPADILENEELFDALYKSLEEARRIVDEVTSSATSKGYIIAKRREPKVPDSSAQQDDKTKDLLYEDFHPFLPSKFSNDPAFTIVTFGNFNKTVDEFFSSIEGQKLESRLSEREAAAKRKLDAVKEIQAKRVEGLVGAQTLNLRKAGAIEANIERVQEAMDAVNGLIYQGMDWVNIGKLIEREQKRQNPVAEIIKLPLNLAENTITLLLAEEEDGEEDDNFDYETDSDDSEAETEVGKPKAVDTKLTIDINLGISPFSNARDYYDQKRTAAVKEQKTLQQSTIALKSAEHKITEDLKKGLKQEKAVLQPIRRQMWFEKFLWFVSSDGLLVLGGRDPAQSEILYRRHLRKGDTYVHSDVAGAAIAIIKNNPKTPDAPIPPSTLAQAGILSVCSSKAWETKAAMGAWWVPAEKVTKSAPSGEYLKPGSFNVKGSKNYLAPAPLFLGFGLMWKISEESKARHVKHRVYDAPVESADQPSVRDADESRDSEEGQDASSEVHDEPKDAEQEAPAEEGDDDFADEKEDENEYSARQNAFQQTEEINKQEVDQNDGKYDNDFVSDVAKLNISAPPGPSKSPRMSGAMPADDIEDLADKDNDNGEDEDEDEEDEKDDTVSEAPSITTPASSVTPNQKQAPPAKRGQKGKKKKLAKYRDQDEDDRAAIEAILGSAVGKQRAEAEAKAKAERETEREALRERRRQQQEKLQKTTAQHEAIRRKMLEDGVEMLDDDEPEDMTLLDALVGTPLAGDEILEAIPVCMPWTSMVKCKYKAKIQPGMQKKGKAVKEILDKWRIVAAKKGVIDENAKDSERMWPREVELIKGLKPEEAFNCVPVSKVGVVMSGGSAGGGGGGGGGSSKGGGGHGKGNRGGKGSKRK